MPQITEFDIFFLSFDEPNAEKHWSDLLDKAPWAKRVHGVKGFASAHRACANESETDWFVTVDADNIVRPEFFDHAVELDGNPLQCYSWDGLNMMNGLRYGNGGLKLWSKEFVLSDRIGHEASKDATVDFCWDDNYQQVHKTFSEVWPNGSAYQAFRAGFREGIKLTLDRGERIGAKDMRSQLHPMNLRNLRVWCSVGNDIEYGDCAIFGARLAWTKMFDPDFDHKMVSDFDKIAAIYDEETNNEIWTQTIQLGKDIETETGIEIPNFDETGSAFVREICSL